MLFRSDHASHEQNDRKALRKEIDDLKKKLRRAQQKRPSPGSGTSSDEDNEYRRRSRTPSSETFSYEEERPRKRSHKSPSYQGLANDAMSKALDRISQLPFTRRIERAALPSTNVRHIQWSVRPSGACEPIQSKDGRPYQG